MKPMLEQFLKINCAFLPKVSTGKSVTGLLIQLQKSGGAEHGIRSTAFLLGQHTLFSLAMTPVTPLLNYEGRILTLTLLIVYGKVLVYAC